MCLSSGGFISSTTFFFRCSGVGSRLSRFAPSTLERGPEASLTDCCIEDTELPDDGDREGLIRCGGGGFKYFSGICGVGTGGVGIVCDLPEWKLSEREDRNDAVALGRLAGERSSEPFEADGEGRIGT